jgi:coiled-coil and C2 domain-containing protein 2A
MFNLLLEHFEAHGIDQEPNPDKQAPLDRFQKTYNISGFPIHFGFSDIKPIEESVFNTDVHSVQEPGVEFSLAVRVFPYPQRLYSVWVHVASLLRK